jgi:hypothetical protein
VYNGLGFLRKTAQDQQSIYQLHPIDKSRRAFDCYSLNHLQGLGSSRRDSCREPKHHRLAELRLHLFRPRKLDAGHLNNIKDSGHDIFASLATLPLPPASSHLSNGLALTHVRSKRGFTASITRATKSESRGGPVSTGAWTRADERTVFDHSLSCLRDARTILHAERACFHHIDLPPAASLDSCESGQCIRVKHTRSRDRCLEVAAPSVPVVAAASVSSFAASVVCSLHSDGQRYSEPTPCRDQHPQCLE